MGYSESERGVTVEVVHEEHVELAVHFQIGVDFDEVVDHRAEPHHQALSVREGLTRSNSGDMIIIFWRRVKVAALLRLRSRSLWSW